MRPDATLNRIPASPLRPCVALWATVALATLGLAGAPPAREPKPPEPPSAKVLTAEGWDLVERVFGLVLRDYVDPKTPEQVVRGALQGAASAAGPESAYVPPDEVAAYRAAEAATRTLPLYVTKGDDFARVIAVFPGTEKGPEPGDFLKSIDGRSTYDLTYPQLLGALAGKAGARAQCVFLKHEAFETYHLTLPYVPLPEPVWTERPGGAVLSLPSLPAELPPPVRDAMKASRAGTVLVDLRDCAQGDARAALQSAGLLLGKAEGPRSRGQKGEIRHPLSGAGLLAGKKLRVLVGPGTARGGEVLARALEDAGALVVGSTTVGWAPLAEVFPLENGGVLRLNTQMFLDRDGKPLMEVGIVPRIDMAPVEGESRETLYDRALAAQPQPAPAVEKTAQLRKARGA